MKRVIGALILGIMLTLALTAAVSAHNLEVANPHTGEVVNQNWVGGFTVPAQAPPMFGPFNLPPSHNAGLVKACQATKDNSVVTFIAPPYGSCQHGVQPAP
jgi:hypothetical protein